MKRLVAILAIAALAVTPVYAQDQPALTCTTVAPVGPGLQVVGQPRVVKGQFVVTVNGRIANASERPRSGVVTVTLFDEAANIVGVYRGAVTSVAANDEVTYTALGTDMPESWAMAEAKVSEF